MANENTEKWRSIGVISRRSGNRVKEWRDPIDGHRVKATRDEATERGNTVYEHNTKDDRVDVQVRPDTIEYKLGRA